MPPSVVTGTENPDPNGLGSRKDFKAHLELMAGIKK